MSITRGISRRMEILEKPYLSVTGLKTGRIAIIGVASSPKVEGPQLLVEFLRMNAPIVVIKTNKRQWGLNLGIVQLSLSFHHWINPHQPFLSLHYEPKPHLLFSNHLLPWCVLAFNLSNSSGLEKYPQFKLKLTFGNFCLVFRVIFLD